MPAGLAWPWRFDWQSMFVRFSAGKTQKWIYCTKWGKFEEKKHLNCILFIERELRESFVYLNIHLLFYYTTESFITAKIYTFITLTCFNWYVCLSNTAFSSILSVEVLSNIESTHFCLPAWSMDKVLIEEFLQLIRPSDCRGGYIWHFWITRSLTQGLTHTGTELSRAVPPSNTV